MESHTNLLKSVIVTESQYNSHKIERNLLNLQRHIDALINKTSRGCSLKFFNPAEVLPAECLGCIVSLVADPATKQSLVLKCLLLFNNLVSDCTIRENLHEKFQLTPALVNVIRHNGKSSSNTITLEALQLLQKVTYGQRVSFQEPYMETLVNFLLSQVTYPTTGYTQPAMGVLVNLTRDNFSVISYIKNNSDVRKLSRHLTELMGDMATSTILYCLTLLHNICSQDKVGGKFFKEDNLPGVFQMIFNTLIEGDSGDARRYAVDLFKDLIKEDKMAEWLTRFEHIDTCIEQTLNLVTCSSAESVVKIYDLLQTFCSIPSLRRIVCKAVFATFQIQDQASFANLSQTPLSRIADPLLATIHWAGQSTDTHFYAAVAAYDLLIEVYEELVFSHDRIHHEKHIKAVLPTALQTLKVPLEGDNLTIQRRCEAMVKCVKLLLVFCNNDSFLGLLSKHMGSTILISLVQYQFDNNSVAGKLSLAPPTDDWSMTGVDLFLQLLDLIKRLKTQTLEDFFFAAMQGEKVVPFLACGLSSSNRQRVQDTMMLIVIASKLDGFDSIILAETLANRNAQREAASNQSSPRSFMPGVDAGLPTRNKRPLLEDKENWEPSMTSSKLLGNSSGQDLTVSAQDDCSRESLQALIDKMNKGFELKDGNSSEIVTVYERSIQALQTKEQHLQDLLEVRTLALTQADCMLAQYRARKGQDEAQSNRLRSLLIQANKKCEALDKDAADMKTRLDTYTKDNDELLLENEKLQQVAQMHQQLTTAHTELTEKLEQVQKSYQTMRQEHKSLTEMHEMLQKHNANLKQQYDTAIEQLNTLQEERRKMSTQLKSVETKLDDTKKSALKWEYDYKRSEEERETMEMSIEKLRNQMAQSDTKKKQLVEQVSQLEFACSQNETTIANYEAEIKELKVEVNKHKHIAALINSLSSGNVSEMSGAAASNTSNADH